MLRYLLLFFGLFLVVFAHSQTLEGSQTSNNLTTFFPSFAGWHGGVQFNGFYRAQWAGFEGRPETHMVNGDGYLHAIRSGIGLSYAKDGLGQVHNQSFTASVSPRVKVGNKLWILPSIGVKHSILTIGSNWSNNGQSVDTSYSHTRFNTGLGAAYGNWFGAAQFLSPTSQNGFRQLGQLNFLLGRNFETKQLTLTPTFYCFSDMFRSPEVRLALNAQHGWMIFGIGYTYNSNVTIAFGAELLNRYRLSYSYDFNGLAVVQGYRGSRGSHDLALRVLLFNRPEHRIIKNVPIL